jgi:hypothetical protein
MLFEAITKGSYTGGDSILTHYVCNWRNGLISGSRKSSFVLLKFQLGEAFQFDWSEESLIIDGIHRKIQVARTKLCASRAFYLSTYPTQTLKMHMTLSPKHSLRWVVLSSKESTTIRKQRST